MRVNLGRQARVLLQIDPNVPSRLAHWDILIVLELNLGSPIRALLHISRLYRAFLFLSELPTVFDCILVPRGYDEGEKLT